MAMNFQSMLNLLRCPTCEHTEFIEDRAKIRCTHCATSFPIIADIPWIQRDPDFQVEQWKGRVQLLMKSLANEEERIKLELADTKLRESTRQRLSRLLQAKVEHRKELSSLMQPLGLNLSGSIDREQTFRSTSPESMQLMGYYSNVFRDWAWETSENADSLTLFRDVTGNSSLADQVVLTIGAGAGRFSFDIHQELKPTTSIVCDINPYLLMVARRVTKGAALSLYDFPVAPVDDQSQFVRHKLKAAGKANPGFLLLAADGVNFPGREQSFDWVITPWFIDIIGVDTAELARKINRLLKPGGRWYNFGTLVYHQKNLSKNYGRVEVKSIVVESGFEWGTELSRSLVYLDNPASAQRRSETAWAFVATKREHLTDSPPIENWPDWLRDVHRPVPLLQEIQQTMAINQNFNFIMAQIDGQRSISDIATTIAPHFGFAPGEATAMLRQLLMRLHETSIREQKF
jgi:ubiquinone/menaquinone biosynthesis C-methylase UbiE/uncharacterized protein YbaR (Trm112 family)